MSLYLSIYPSTYLSIYIYILYIKETTFILLISILFLYSGFHGKKDYQSSEGLDKNYTIYYI